MVNSEDIVEKRILELMADRKPVYAHAMTSEEIGEALNLTPSYVREKMRTLVKRSLIQVRRGPKGGYYLMKKKELLVRIDSNELTIPLDRTFTEIYQEIKQEILSNGRLISEVWVNGVRTLDEYVADLKDAEVHEIAMATRTKDELIVEMMVTAQDYLPRLHSGLAKVATLIQGGGEGAGSLLFVESIEGLQWLNMLVEGILGSTFQNQIVQNLDWQETRHNLNETIQNLLDAWQNQDYVLISDLLEYELCPNIEKWTVITKNILQLCGKECFPDGVEIYE